ncbi:uncharacterized protein [Heptranchias perlo]|uniref:uncharacterized protein isoform X2 n=1 Tax=Heptranchias perlo TaxID=212740 RepID=UPI003559F048
MAAPFTVLSSALWISLVSLPIPAAMGRYSVCQNPPYLSVREGEPIRISCSFNYSGRRELETVVFKWFVNNVTHQLVKTASNKTYWNDSEQVTLGLRIEGDLERKFTTLIVDRATRNDGGVYVCHVSIIKPLLNQRDLHSNGTVVTVLDAKAASSPIFYVTMSGLALGLLLTVCLLTRTACRGNVDKTAQASPTSGQEPCSSQYNNDPQPFTIASVYSSLRLSKMMPPPRERGGERGGEMQGTEYCTVQCTANNIREATVGRAVKPRGADTSPSEQHAAPQ